MKAHPLFLVLGMALAPLAFASRVSELEAPFRILADQKPIDVEIGHAAPLWVDFDRDGLTDLLVGQFGGGKLLIYRNLGDSKTPRFKDAAVFRAAGEDGVVPSG